MRMTEDCTDSMTNLSRRLSTIEGILTYDGGQTDILLNYIALALTLSAAVMVCRLFPLDLHPVVRYSWLPVTVFLFVFQVSPHCCWL